MIYDYLKRIFKKWFGKFTLISSISGFILFYTNIDTRNFIIEIIYSNLLYVSILFLFIATYQVWKDIKIEKIALEKKLENPIDYDIKAVSQKVKLDIAYFENEINTSRNKASIKLIDLKKEIESLQIENVVHTLLPFANYSSVLSGIEPKSDSEFISDLNYYKKELEEYLYFLDHHLDNIKSFIESDLKKIYYISFYIKNTGIKSDEDIDVELFFKNDSKYIGYLETLENYPSLKMMPNKPSRTVDINSFIRAPSFDNMEPFNNMRDSNPMAYRKYEKIEVKKFTINLKNLKATEKVRIFRDNGYLIYLEDKDDIELNIISKNSNASISKKAIFEESEDYDYLAEKEGKEE